MHALAQLCVRRPVFATMLVLSLVVVGIFAYFTLGVDQFPNIDIPTVAVTVSNPGASPEEIETEITKKIEDSVNTISQIDELRSTSSEGQSQVIITFELSKNGDIAAQEVQNKVNLAVPTLPQSAKQPVVQKFDPGAVPVMQIAVSAPRSVRDVTLIADKLIKQRVENAKGVGEVTISGGAQREIHVQVDPDRLRSYNLTVTDVFNALKQQNLEMPGGNLNAGSRELTVRTTGKVIDAPQFNEITIAIRGGHVIKVKDIGYAEDSSEEPRTAARLDGLPAVTLTIAKQSGMNTVETADAIKERLNELAPTLPKDIHWQIIADQSTFIKASLHNIKEHLIEGSILAAVVIFFFLANWRTTLISAIAIPTSIISTFALMAAMGFTLNMITMLALTLMVGVVIDDAIIVLEKPDICEDCGAALPGCRRASARGAGLKPGGRLKACPTRGVAMLGLQRRLYLHAVFLRLHENLLLIQRQTPAIAHHRLAVHHHIAHIFRLERVYHLRHRVVDRNRVRAIQPHFDHVGPFSRFQRSDLLFQAQNPRAAHSGHLQNGGSRQRLRVRRGHLLQLGR